jgi:hypothetical protein
MPATPKALDNRVHIVYELTIGADTYVGVTAKTENTLEKSVTTRISNHWYRAHTDARDWLICQALRRLQSRHDVQFRVLATKEGKVPAHKIERVLIAELNPSLNTDKRGM